MTDEPTVESKFLKSTRNRGTENAGLQILLRDRRIQAVPVDVKRILLERLGAPDANHQAFDAVRTASPAPVLTALSLEAEVDSLQLVEMKTTRRPIEDASLRGFFFGVTESEFALAQRLGDRYLFAFVVLNDANVFGTEFFVLLTYEQLQLRIHSKRTQYQVTLRRGTYEVEAPYGIWPDSDPSSAE